jgi:hypothetical protein
MDTVVGCDPSCVSVHRSINLGQYIKPYLKGLNSYLQSNVLGLIHGTYSASMLWDLYLCFDEFPLLKWFTHTKYVQFWEYDWFGYHSNNGAGLHVEPVLVSSVTNMNQRLRVLPPGWRSRDSWLLHAIECEQSIAWEARQVRWKRRYTTITPGRWTRYRNVVYLQFIVIALGTHIKIL